MSSMHWNQETKNKLNEKLTLNLGDLGSVARQVIRASKSTELLAQAAKNFSSQETVIHNSAESLKKMSNVKTQLEHQESSIERSMSTLDDVHDLLKTIQR